MPTFEQLKAIYDKLGTDEKLKAVKPSDLFSVEDYEKVATFANETERPAGRIIKDDHGNDINLADNRSREYNATPVGDLYIRVVYRPFRLDQSKMIYIFNLDQVSENLYNDDLYWRSEPVKFCQGLPDYETCLSAIQKLLDYRSDNWENKSKVLNVPWDPEKPEFDS